MNSLHRDVLTNEESTLKTNGNTHSVKQKWKCSQDTISEWNFSIPPPPCLLFQNEIFWYPPPPFTISEWNFSIPPPPPVYYFRMKFFDTPPPLLPYQNGIFSIKTSRYEVSSFVLEHGWWYWSKGMSVTQNWWSLCANNGSFEKILPKDAEISRNFSP